MSDENTVLDSIRHLVNKINNEFHSSAEVYNKCIGPVNERKDEETDWKNYLLSNLQTSHRLLSFAHLNKALLSLTLTDVSGNNFTIKLRIILADLIKPW